MSSILSAPLKSARMNWFESTQTSVAALGARFGDSMCEQQMRQTLSGAGRPGPQSAGAGGQKRTGISARHSLSQQRVKLVPSLVPSEEFDDTL